MNLNSESAFDCKCGKRLCFASSYCYKLLLLYFSHCVKMFNYVFVYDVYSFMELKQHKEVSFAVAKYLTLFLCEEL